jgi:hypothetical protein
MPSRSRGAAFLREKLSTGARLDPRRALPDDTAMDHDEFKAAWDNALREAGLERLVPATETIDARTMERRYEVAVLPIGGQTAEPFHVTALLSWRWDAVQSARSRSTEEDLLTEVLGHAEDVDTEVRRLRIDIVLRASLPWGNAIPMPSPASWRRWMEETLGRLERVEPILPNEAVREGEGGRLEVFAWKDEPHVEAICRADGSLTVSEVGLAAWQVIELPRKWDDPEREADEPAAHQLGQMFVRVRAALHAWMEATDHLAPRKSKAHLRQKSFLSRRLPRREAGCSDR